MPPVNEAAPSHRPLAVSPFSIRSEILGIGRRTRKKTAIWTTMAIRPQMTQSTKATELAIALASGREKPTRLPAKASEAARLFSRISLNLRVRRHPNVDEHVDQRQNHSGCQISKEPW